MAGQLPEDPSCQEIARNSIGPHLQEDSFMRKWYFSKVEIEDYSPSRKEGITHKEESYLRKLYCSYLQELGMELKVPQVTIATAMLLCHRFYMRQSHAKNHWQIIATASMFLACKAEETPRRLSDLAVVAYKLMYEWDPLAPKRIRQREIYDKQKEIIVHGERLLLGTVAFDLNIELPYKPLVAAVKKLDILQKDLVKVAWNFVNDWLRTTLCLQYKPHYIAAGSLFIAAKLQKVKLPTVNGNVWWMQFDVSPKLLEEVIQRMLKLLEQNKKPVLQSIRCKMPESKSISGKGMLTSPKSCISSGSVFAEESMPMAGMEEEGASRHAVSTYSQKKSCSDAHHDRVKETDHCHTNGCCSEDSIVEDGELDSKPGESDQKSGCKIVSFEASKKKIDVHRIRERLKKRRLDRRTQAQLVGAMDDDIDSESWIVRQLENGVGHLSAPPKKSKRIV